MFKSLDFQLKILNKIGKSILEPSSHFGQSSMEPILFSFFSIRRRPSSWPILAHPGVIPFLGHVVPPPPTPVATITPSPQVTLQRHEDEMITPPPQFPSSIGAPSTPLPLLFNSVTSILKTHHRPLPSLPIGHLPSSPSQ
jgi:hypothetical protein